jgi:hypothetical protein
MLTRCYNPRHAYYESYGGRGIKVEDATWLTSFVNFFADMGRKPSPKHSLDRINNDLGYFPANCRWATALEQRHNQRPRKRKRRRSTLAEIQAFAAQMASAGAEVAS